MNSENSISNVQIKPLGFIKSFIGTCCGTAVFSTLCRHSVVRMLWHLFLLAVLLAFAVSWFGSRENRSRIAAAEEIFTNSFGSKITCYTDGAFVPEKNPEQPRVVVFPGFGKLFYSPLPDRGAPDRSEYADLIYFGVWTPGMVLFAFRNAPDNWMVNRISGSRMSFGMVDDPNDLFRYAEGKKSGTGLTISSSQLFNEISMAYNFRNWISHFVAIFILPLIYSALLLLVVRFSFARVSPQPTWLLWWKCGVYAAFPGALISSAIVALELPLISFSTAYMLTSMVYGLHAVMRIELEKKPADDTEENDSYGEQ